MIRTLSFLLLSSAVFAADVLPSANIPEGQWARHAAVGSGGVGPAGGIPDTSGWTVYNVLDYGADPTGVASSETAFQDALAAAIAAMPAAARIYAPTGTYKISTPVDLRSNMELVGDGMFLELGGTVVKMTGGLNGVNCRPDPSISGPENTDNRAYNPTGTVTPGSGGFTKGSNTVTLTKTDNGVNFAAGRFVYIWVPDDPSIPVSNFGGAFYSRRWQTVVTSVDNTDPLAPILTLDLPIPATYGTTYGTAHFEQCQPVAGLFNRSNVGVRNIAFDGTGDTMAIAVEFSNVNNAWVKNVRSYKHNGYGFSFAACTRLEVRGCFVQQPRTIVAGSNGAGILLNTCYASLFEDNITIDNFPGWEINSSTTACAMIGNTILSSTIQTHAYDVNHGPHNHLNLHENNIVTCMLSDAFFGSHSHDTFNRNWFMAVKCLAANWNTTTGVPTSPTGDYAMVLKKFSRNFAYINNITGFPGYHTFPLGDNSLDYDGTPNMGNGDYVGTASLIGADPWFDWDTGRSPHAGVRSWAGTVTSRSALGATEPGYYDTVITFDAGSATSFTNRETAYSGLMPWNGYVTATQYTTGLGAFSPRDGSQSLASDELTFQSTSSPAVSTVVVLYPSGKGLQERDLDVAATMTSRGNVDAEGNAVRTAFGVGETALTTYMADGLPAGVTYIGPDNLPTGIGATASGARFLEWVDVGYFASDGEGGAGGRPAYKGRGRGGRRR